MTAKTPSSKTIGIIGGMSWESTQTYYELINNGIKAALGGLHSANIIMRSVDFAEVAELQMADDWQACADLLTRHAKALESAGADFFVIATNTMHSVADDVVTSVDIPLLHIADATGKQIVRDEVQQIALLGTRFTMEQDFYNKRLKEKYGIKVIIPDETQREIIHNVIYQELCLGNINESSRKQYLAIINDLSQAGAQACVLGCTEIPLLVDNSHTKIPLYDTTALHAQAAVDMALGG